MHWPLVFLATFTLLFFMQGEATPCNRLLSIEEAQDLALRNNKQIRELEFLLQKAREGRLEAVSKWWPQITGMSQVYRAQDNFLPLLNSRASFLTQVELTQSLFSSEIYYGIKIAALEQQRLFFLLQAIRNDVLYAVRTAYYQVVLDRQLIETAQEHIDLLSFLVKRMEERLQTGLTIIYNVNQSKVAMANATTRYYQAVRQLKNDRDRLTQIVGLDPACTRVDVTATEIPVQEIPLLACKLHLLEGQIPDALPDSNQLAAHSVEMVSRLFLPEEIAQWEKESNCFRPDIRLSVTLVQLACRGVEKSQGEYLPSLTLYGSYGGLPMPYVVDLSNSFFEQSFQWGVGVELDWLIFDSFGREHRINQAKAQETANKFQLQNTVELAHVDVRDQIYAIEEALSNFTTSRASMYLAQELVQQSNDQLQVGYITIFDYQIAVDTLIQARFTYEQARFQLAQSYFGLRHATAVDLCSIRRQ